MHASVVSVVFGVVAIMSIRTTAAAVAVEPNAAGTPHVYRLDRPTKYLLYSVNPGEGFNLARDVYTRAAALVAALNHTHTRWILVLPPFTNPHWPHGTGTLSWDDVFDLQALEETSSAVPAVMSLQSFLQDVRREPPQIDHILHLHLSRPPVDGPWKPGVTRASSCRFGSYPGTSFSQDDGTGQWTGSFWGLGDNVRARELTCLEMMGSATLLAPLLQDSNTVAPSASVVMIARLETTMALHTTTTQYQAIRRSMRFAPALVDTATTIIASHRQHRYLSVHLRRADFLRVRSANIPPLASTRKQILALARAHDIRALFIATDARRDDEEYDAFASNPPLPLVDTPQHIKSTLHPGQLAVVQQIVCARAFIFIGTEGSTFTRQIQEERQLRGHRSNTSLSLTSPRRATTEQG